MIPKDESTISSWMLVAPGGRHRTRSPQIHAAHPMPIRVHRQALQWEGVRTGQLMIGHGERNRMPGMQGESRRMQSMPRHMGTI